jgi:hypothetical protein
VFVADPVPVVVEVFFNCSYLGLERRLRRVFAAGVGSVLIVMVEEGRYSADRVEHHLNKVTAGEFRVGRVSVADLSVSLGTQLMAAQVDLSVFEESGVVPAYIR